jgi:hypothetical protein
MFNFLKKLFGIADTAAPQAPYKVETPKQPEPVKCGCGRSPTGYCVGLHKLSETEWATHADNPNKVAAAPVAEVAEKAKKPAKKAAKPKATGGAKKPAARTAKPKASKPKE